MNCGLQDAGAVYSTGIKKSVTVKLLLVVDAVAAARTAWGTALAAR